LLVALWSNNTWIFPDQFASGLHHTHIPVSAANLTDMSDAEKENKPEALAAPPTGSSAEPKTEANTPETTLEQARKFLQDAEVQDTTPERKAEFLKSKGLSESDIQGLLNEVTQDARLESQASVCPGLSLS
jgi:hypothetical protein